MVMQYSYSSAEKNAALCRKELDLITTGNFRSNGYEECRNMVFFKVNGITKFWKNEGNINISSLMRDVLSGCVRHGVSFAFVITGDQNGITFHIGTLAVLLDSLKTSFISCYPGIDIDDTGDNPLHQSILEYGGMFTGIPVKKESSQIENICRGMLGTNFIYVILASGISNIAVSLGHDRILEEMEAVYPLINQTVSGGNQGNLTAEKKDFYSDNYFENLKLLEQFLQTGISIGMWRMNGYYASDQPLNAKKLGSIIRANFSGEESKPDPFRLIEYNEINNVIKNTYMMADLISNQQLHPLGRWWQDGFEREIALYIYKFQTLLSSEQLAILCQLPAKEVPGYYVDDYVEFDVSNRNHRLLKDPVPLGQICAARRQTGQTISNQYCMEKDDFTRHALIIGITGGGKTNTTKAMLHTLWNTGQPNEKVPFMVIESAKREYWELRNLKGFDDLLVFTLGAETSHTSVRYRINPFETIAGISLQTHIDYLLTTFKAAFDLYPPMPYILEMAVYEVYSDRGWDIVENINHYGLTEYPTLSDLYHKIDVIVDNMGYHQEIQSNVKAALQARIKSLMIGGKGAMLNTPRSVPIDQLLSRPVVMELEDLGDDDTKSFVIGILLVQLYEYRKAGMIRGSKALSHILVVEEAHRLLKNVPETGEGGSSRARSVEFFCNLLAEIRSFGQGFIIADQIPTKIASDAIKNTNLKVVHRTVAREDRETIGHAMNMSQEQIDYLSSLPRGYAAVYAEGDNKPKIVKMPLMTACYDKARTEVITEVRNKVYQIAAAYDQVICHHSACAYCEQRCRYNDMVQKYINSNVVIDKVLQKWELQDYHPEILQAFLNSGIIREVHNGDDIICRCCIGYLLEFQRELKNGQRQTILADYLRYINKN